MRLRIDEDSELRDAILAPLIDGAIWDLIRAAAHRTRSAWVQTDEAIAGATNAAIRLRAAAASLYEWPLPGGMQLGKASREQVAEGAALYEQNASRNAARAKWLRAIEKKVKPGKSVAQSLSVAQLAKMRKEHNA
jgi:hypothetical protein